MAVLPWLPLYELNLRNTIPVSGNVLWRRSCKLQPYKIDFSSGEKY